MNSEQTAPENTEEVVASVAVDSVVAAEPTPLEPVPVEVAAPAVTAPVPGVDDASMYIHREMSQLQFNWRVLEQALDESYPLLERLKFLLIFSGNLDEFFEIRVAGLKRQLSLGRSSPGPDGMLPHEVLTPERLRTTFGVQGHWLTDPLDGARVLRLRQLPSQESRQGNTVHAR